MLDILIAFGIAVFTFGLGILGVIVTFLPPKSTRSKKRWMAIFLICGLLGCGLVGLQTYRTVTQQNALNNSIGTLQQTLTRSETGREVDNAYLKAKLEDYKQLQDLAPALLAIARASEGYTKKQYESQVSSKKQLLINTDNLLTRIHALGSKCSAKERAIFETNYEPNLNWQAMTPDEVREHSRQISAKRNQAYEENRLECANTYRMTIQGDAAFLRAELLSRTGGDSFLPPLDKQKEMAIDGVFSGPDPIDDSGEYLQALATKLKQLPPRQP